MTPHRSYRPADAERLLDFEWDGGAQDQIDLPDGWDRGSLSKVEIRHAGIVYWLGLERRLKHPDIIGEFLTGKTNFDLFLRRVKKRGGVG